ncbi:TPA: hypothetical protein HA361_03670 [Candidatus Woesearchaeota archaeon]|nr:hypothetical protein [Candidatus Woesearchaeota archaeon]HII69108.1 hypothetical protein [Candidatus Woesearchaeota archaeon]
MSKKISTYTIAGLFTHDFSRRYYLKEMADALGKPHQTLKPYIAELVKQSILMEEKRGNLLEYTLNTGSPLVVAYLAIAEQEQALEQAKKEGFLVELFSLGREMKGAIIAAPIDKERWHVVHVGGGVINREHPRFSFSHYGQFEEIPLEELKGLYRVHVIFRGVEEVVSEFVRRYALHGIA